jgi:hypothetical protein
VTCASTIDQAGVTAFNALVNCLQCTACYTTCDGAAAGSGCTGAPAMTDACDTGTPGTMTCQACAQCAQMKTCASQVTACKAITQCVDLANNLSATCGSLPM